MSISAVLSYAAAYFSLILTATVLLRDRHSFVHRTFATGILLFGAEELVRGISYGAILPEDVIYWQKWIIAVSALIPAVWLGFSLGYARADFQRFITKWKWALLAAGVVPCA